MHPEIKFHKRFEPALRAGTKVTTFRLYENLAEWKRRIYGPDGDAMALNQTPANPLSVLVGTPGSGQPPTNIGLIWPVITGAITRSIKDVAKTETFTPTVWTLNLADGSIYPECDPIEDGFNSHNEMVDFFRELYPTQQQLRLIQIRWNKLYQ